MYGPSTNAEISGFPSTSSWTHQPSAAFNSFSVVVRSADTVTFDRFVSAVRKSFFNNGEDVALARSAYGLEYLEVIFDRACTQKMG
jgi:hypothetical protein